LHIIYDFSYGISLFGVEVKRYVMYKGKVRGIFDEWEDYQKQVNGLSSNNHKGFKTKEQAKAS
jgi:viroplasmin and RNaseH domain-containing protein